MMVVLAVGLGIIFDKTFWNENKWFNLFYLFINNHTYKVYSTFNMGVSAEIKLTLHDFFLFIILT